MKDIKISLHQVFELLSDAVIVIDRHGQIDYANHASTILFGYTEPELLGMPLSLLLPEELRSRHTDLVSAFQNAEHALAMGARPILHGQNKMGQKIPLSVSLSRLDLDEARYTLAVVRDASGFHDHLSAVSYLADSDPLTGLANRRPLSAMIRQAIAADQRFALLFIDLRRFKPFNDRYGHHVGDEVLKIVARRLLKFSQDSDLIARFGGDEFVVLAQKFDHPKALRDFAKDVAHGVTAPFTIDNLTAAVEVNIGGAIFPMAGRTETELLIAADTQMYLAKQSDEHCRIAGFPDVTGHQTKEAEKSA